MSFLELDSVSKRFGDHLAVEDLRLSVAKGEFISLLGPSGCGKTTLLRLAAGLDRDFDGTIDVNGTEVRGPGRDRGVVFQESRLFPWMRVEANVRFGLPEGLPDEVREARLEHALRLNSSPHNGKYQPA